MAQKKIIAVVGATGAQGGGLARAILDDKSGAFSVRALTRNPDSDKARQLAKRGADVVAADLDDSASIRAAFAGAWGAFCVTNFWEHFSPQKEQAQAQAMAEAAADCALKHVIWSTLEDTRQWVALTDPSVPTLMQYYKVPHFDGKGASDHYFTDQKVPTTFLRAAFYWDNLITFGMGPRQDADGRLIFALPLGEDKLPGIAAEDIGRCAYGIFKAGDKYIGQTLGIAGEHQTGEGMAAALSVAYDRPVHYQAIALDDYRKLGFPGAEDLANMYLWQHKFNAEFCRARDVDLARQLNPRLQSFAKWLQHHARDVPIN